MRRQHDEAYVLKTQELGEADLIVTLLTRHLGKVRAVGRSARKSRRRFGGLLEPLTHVRVTWFEKEGRDLHQLDSVEGIRSFAEMQADPLRQAACAVLAEVCGVFAQEGHGDPRDFRLVGALLEALEQRGAPWMLVRYFEYWMLRLHGLLPGIKTCAACGRPLEDLATAHVRPGHGLHCANCLPPGASSRRLTTLERKFLSDAERLPPSEMPQEGASLRASGGLELLLRGTLEEYAERPFRAYRHFRAAELFDATGTRGA